MIWNFLRNRSDEWREVKYPLKKSSFPFFFLISMFLGSFLLLIKLRHVTPSFTVSGLIDIFFLSVWGYFNFKFWKVYVRFKNNRNSTIGSRLAYLIDSLKLYDEEAVEIVEGDGKTTKEKRIVRSIRIFYKETEKNIYVRIMKYGDRFTQLASTLNENLEASLGMELDSINATVNFVEYSFLKRKDERIHLASTIRNLSVSDEIRISGNISYELHKVPHSLIVGGTGSGKSYFILGKIVSYLNLTPQADLRIIDPKKADLSLLRFTTGFGDKVATEANDICKMLREVVELMEQRYSNYFNDVSAFGKTYRDFNLPVVIVIFDEFAAFMHSVDKKIAKEALDYVFQIVMKGRQAGVMIEILMQRPSADDLPTNIRSQMGFKAGLGAMDSIGYNMIFDTKDVEYKTVVEKGGGYIQIDGIHTAPVYFETPYIERDFDFIAEIERLMQNNHQISGDEAKIE